jgi:hypothetical protein
MSVVAFTFGSFGDILATAGLVAKICQALYDPCDRSLKDELRFLHQLLLLTHDVVQRQRSTPLAQNLVLLVQETVTQCNSEMQSFLRKIDDIRKPLAWTSIARFWGKVLWAAHRPDEVVKLREGLSAHRQTLTCLLAALNKSVSTCLHLTTIC